mgnify:FL=1
MNAIDPAAGLTATLRLAHPGFALDVAVGLPERGVTALFGRSGSGKTTVLRCMAGLEPQVQGRVALGGAVWQDSARSIFLPPHQRPVGLVFQDARLFAHLSVRANIEYGMKRVPAAQRRISVDDVVALLGIGHLMDRRPARLSGGEAQRVAIARALLTSPRLLLLDEPLASLDEARKAEVLPYLERLHDELEMPVLYVSHSMNEIAHVADHLLLIDAGRLRAAGPVDEVSARLDLPLAQADGAAAVLTGTVAGHDAEFGLSRLDVAGQALWVPHIERPIGAPVRFQVAARDVSVALSRAVDSSIVNVLPAIVAARADDDHGRSLLQLDIGGALLLSRITRRSAEQLALAPGRRVHAQIKGVALLG